MTPLYVLISIYFITYFVPKLIVHIGKWYLTKFFKKLLAKGYSVEKNAKIAERLFKSRDRKFPKEDELHSYHWLNSKFLITLKKYISFYLLPVFYIRMFLIFMFKGVRIVWVMPFSFYEIWDFVLIYIAFNLVQANWYCSVGIISVIFLSHLFKIGDFFNPNIKNTEYYFKLPHKLSISDLLHTYFSFIGCFSIGYAILGKYEKLSLNETLNSFFDFIYISITVMTTVGFGDIRPLDTISRLVFSSQMVIGILLNLIFISMFMGMWLSVKVQKKIELKDK